MSDSEHLFKSNQLHKFIDAYIKAVDDEEKDLLWNSTTTPFVEKILENDSISLVTFLYRKSHADANSEIYIDCNAVGLALAPDSQLRAIAGTDLCYLTVTLPNQLRTTYSFLKLANAADLSETKDTAHSIYPYPEFTGELKKYIDTMMRLHAQANVDIDMRNPKKISYHDYHNPDICFFNESILELPDAPIQPAYFYDISTIKHERDELTEAKRFSDYTLSIVDTCLNDKDQSLRETRPYWVYLPPNYDNQRIYPLYLFLDGSDYLNTIPVPSMLERMILNKELSPCIAVFFEYSPERRLLEYYGDERFTQFLAYDFMTLLREQHHLPITQNPAATTIVGLSASGLAAVYAGLACPHVFGNVVTQSAALWCRKWCDMEKWLDDYLLTNADTYFCMEAGIYENISLECRFVDGFTQAMSILEANRALVAHMDKKGVKAHFHEFVGGHNYVCYRGSLVDRLKEIYEMRLTEMNQLNN